MARLGRLRRFLSPQVADAVLSSGGEDVLAPHRREVAVFFIDLRRFTSFTSRVEPEDVVDVLREYYDAVGALLNQFQATIGAFTGDGIMAYFGDPVPCDSPPTSAAELALEVRGRMDDLCSRWTPRGHDLSYGIGLAFGHATLGVVGFGGRSDYTPLGTVVNLGARLCGEAGARQILVDQRLHAAIEPHFATQPVGTVALKGFPNAVAAFEVLGRHARR
jgi:class 3 adenylate cyclase